jgi:hypothetical protein
MTIALPLQPTPDDLAYLENDHTRRYTPHLLDPANPIRQRIIMERAVIRRACTDMLAEGLELRVHDGEAWATLWTSNLDAIMAAIQAVDEEHIHVRESADRARRGSIFLVYGNEGYTVIANHSANLEVALLGASRYADELGDAVAAR